MVPILFHFGFKSVLLSGQLTIKRLCGATQCARISFNTFFHQEIFVIRRIAQGKVSMILVTESNPFQNSPLYIYILEMFDLAEYD